MTGTDGGSPPRVAIVRREVRPEERPSGGPNDRLWLVFQAFSRLGVEARPVTFSEESISDTRTQLLDADCVLVFVDPIHVPDGRDRSVLDPLLREVADHGVVVSTHPEVIMKMGTKEVLYSTAAMDWGSDTRIYRTAEQFRLEFPRAVALAGPRVLKQHRGNGGNGVWKVALSPEAASADSSPSGQTLVQVLHGLRGSVEEQLSLSEFFERCDGYFEGGAPLIDQPFQPRLAEGQIRVYLVEDLVVGFGHQRVAALMPAPASEAPPEPEPRYYHGPGLAELQRLRSLMETQRVPEMQRLLDIGPASLPLLWDADFLYGPRDEHGQDTYVLCEINVSSVIPFPAEAAEPLARATLKRIATRV